MDIKPIYIYILVCALYISLNSVSQDLNEDLVAYYPFDGDILDYSGNNNSGILFNGTFVSGENGSLNSALNFNGVSTFIDLSVLSDLINSNSSNQLSVSFQVNFNTLEPFQVITSLGEDGESLATNVFEIEVENSVFQLETEVGSNAINSEFVLAPLPITNEWICVNTIFDDGTVRFYLNGLLVSEQVFTPQESTCNGFYVGAFSPYTNQACCFLDGKLDNLMIHSRALDDSEIDFFCDFPDLIVDCAGTLNGAFVIDDCGQCLTPSDPDFNNCNDCLGIPNGTALIDLCDQCLYPEDPSFNECAGCTYPNAINYSDLAIVDDGSCEFDYTICDCDGNEHSPYSLTELGDGNPNTTEILSFNCQTWGYDCGDIAGGPNDDPFGVCSGNFPTNNGCICVAERLDFFNGMNFWAYDTLEHAGNKIIDEFCMSSINIIPLSSGGCQVQELCFSLDNQEFTCLNIISGEYYSGDIIDFQTTADAQLVYFYFTVESDESDIYSFYVPECTVGVDENHTNLIRVYPNPAEDHIFLENSKNFMDFNIKLFNSIGSEIKNLREMDRGKNLYLDLSYLADGIYYLSIIEKGKNIQTEKIIISK